MYSADVALSTKIEGPVKLLSIHPAFLDPLEGSGVL